MIVCNQKSLITKNVLSRSEINRVIHPELNALSVIQYGSSINLENSRDTDLLIIYDLNPEKKNLNIHRNKSLDINQVSLENFKLQINNFELDVTEPIINGLSLLDEAEIHQQAKHYLQNNRPSKRAIIHLQNRSIENLIQSQEQIVKSKYDILISEVKNNTHPLDIKQTLFGDQNYVHSPLLEIGINQLGYAISYQSAALRYLKGSKIVTLKELLEDPENELEDCLIEVKHYQKQIEERNLKEITQIYNKAENLLKKNAGDYQ